MVNGGWAALPSQEPKVLHTGLLFTPSHSHLYTKGEGHHAGRRLTLLGVIRVQCLDSWGRDYQDATTFILWDFSTLQPLPKCNRLQLRWARGKRSQCGHRAPKWLKSIHDKSALFVELKKQSFQGKEMLSGAWWVWPTFVPHCWMWHFQKINNDRGRIFFLSLSFFLARFKTARRRIRGADSCSRK